jgi:hypothetical protein
VYYPFSRNLPAPHRVRADVPSAAGSLVRVAVVLLWVLGVASAASRPEVSQHRSADTFEFRNGVIVDVVESRVYLMSPRHGIEALDLRSGELLWQTTSAARPLLLNDGRLIAQAETGTVGNSLPVVVVSARDAGRILLEAEVALPETVQVSVDDGPGTSFRASARLQDNRVIIDWSYSSQQIQGTPPGPGDQGVFLDGAVWMEVDSGHHGILIADDAGTPPGEHLPDDVEELIGQASFSGLAWLTGSVLATIQHNANGDTTLRRWSIDTLESLPDINLTNDGFTYRYVSAGGRHALASRRAGGGEADWLWRVYSLESGRQVAQLRQKSAAARFFLTPSHLIHEAAATQYTVDGVIVRKPLRLRAVELGTALESWTRPLRDTTYRGGYLPSSGLPRNSPSSPQLGAAELSL